MKNQNKPVLSFRFNAEGVKASQDKPESNLVTDWATFRSKLPKEKK